jgi:hypothetical protein
LGEKQKKKKKRKKEQKKEKEKISQRALGSSSLSPFEFFPGGRTSSKLRW